MLWRPVVVILWQRSQLTNVLPLCLCCVSLQCILPQQELLEDPKHYQVGCRWGHAGMNSWHSEWQDQLPAPSGVYAKVFDLRSMAWPSLLLPLGALHYVAGVNVTSKQTLSVALRSHPRTHTPQAVLRYVSDESIVSRLTQRWDNGGQGIVPGGSGSRRSSSAAASADSSSLSVRRWDELVQEVNNEVGVLDCRWRQALPAAACVRQPAVSAPCGRLHLVWQQQTSASIFDGFTRWAVSSLRTEARQPYVKEHTRAATDQHSGKGCSPKHTHLLTCTFVWLRFPASVVCGAG